MPEDTSYFGWMKMVFVARYMMGHCHLGPFEILREDELNYFPLRGELYYRTSALVLVDTGTICNHCYNFCCDIPHERSYQDSVDGTQGTSGYKQIRKKTNHSSRPLINVP